MKLPVQAAPIQRTTTGAPLANGSGVEASGTLDDVLKVITTVGGVAAPILGSLI